MGRGHYSLNKPLREAASLLDDAVTDVRNRGHTRETALARVAAKFGLSVRRAEKLLYGEVNTISDAEHEIIRRRYLDHLDEQAAHYAQRLEATKTKRRQLELGV